MFYQILFILTVLSCKAQSPIVSLEDWDGSEQENAYFKDINNEINDFEGTWLYTNGTTSLKITLVKNVMLFNGKFYEDIMTGGYQYIEDGDEIVNTLDDANNPNLGRSANIHGNRISNNCRYLPVDDCTDGEKRLGLSIKDPNSEPHIGDLIIHKREINGEEAIKIRIEMNYYGNVSGTLPDPSIPWQMHDIILIKQ
jgi:hypothetical protein